MVISSKNLKKKKKIHLKLRYLKSILLKPAQPTLPDLSVDLSIPRFEFSIVKIPWSSDCGSARAWGLVLAAWIACVLCKLAIELEAVVYSTCGPYRRLAMHRRWSRLLYGSVLRTSPVLKHEKHL